MTARLVNLGRWLDDPPAALSFGFAGLFVLACNMTGGLGAGSTRVRYHLVIAFLMFAVIVFGRKVDFWRARAGILRACLHGLPTFIALYLLIGGGRLVSHGDGYARMTTDFITLGAISPLSRRVVMSGLAHLIGIGPRGYVVFWYVVFFTACCMANLWLKARGLGWLERLSILTSSIFGYLLVAPGYSEVFVFLCGIYCLNAKLARVEKVVLAALMFGAHEVATVFVAFPIIVLAADDDRTEWTTIFLSLLAVYAFGYALNWRFDLAGALSIAVKPSADAAESSLQLLLGNPWIALLAVGEAYKLYWIAVVWGWRGRQPREWILTAGIVVALPLMLIATDVSRLVQFGSLAFLPVATDTLSRWPPRQRHWLAVANLAVPTFYAATNAPPLWGTGWYSAYVVIGHAVGLSLGQGF
jgi:hypothetical protein